MEPVRALSRFSLPTFDEFRIQHEVAGLLRAACHKRRLDRSRSAAAKRGRAIFRIDSNPLRTCSELRSCTHETFTSTVFGLALSVLGKWTFSTPSLNSALTFTLSMASGRVKLRMKLP